MANEIFYSALGGAIGGGLIVFLLSSLPRSARFFWHEYIKWKYRKNIDSVIGNWSDWGTVLLPSGNKIEYQKGDEYQDADELAMVQLLKNSIIHQEWSLFKRTLLLLDEIDTITRQKLEEMREKSKKSPEKENRR